ncbi:FKBP-type peptidyl-prolyl cis-trans isomerase [Algoriphagus sp.]|uniref:FKBP-type peptidyl-prolyl cis-trans isomerase n=1 Tax=Algoriphagus sp. TaxID=1872435 RepID=UPI0025DFC177|nr:FKBP-type peptidyl-prolyl cis-trans isomerase [Algoriphagus sp.]
MKIKLYSLIALIAGVASFASCINKEESAEAVYARDVAAIEDYIQNSSLTNVKEYNDPTYGIRIIWQEVSGSGIPVELGDTLRVDYTGKLLSNKVFDSSIESVARDNNIYSSGREYIPLRFRIGLGALIFGFEYGVAQMEQGDKATIFIPSGSGYGRNPNGEIPANSPLIFEMDLIEVVAGPTE